MWQLCLLLLPSASFCFCNVFPVCKIITAQLTLRQLCLSLLLSASSCFCNAFPVYKIITAQLTLRGIMFSVLCLRCFWWRSNFSSTCRQGHIEDQRTSYEGVVGKSNLCLVSLIKSCNFKTDFIFCSFKAGVHTFDSFLQDGSIEYLDVNEENNALVCYILITFKFLWCYVAITWFNFSCCIIIYFIDCFIRRRGYNRNNTYWNKGRLNVFGGLRQKLIILFYMQNYY